MNLFCFGYGYVAEHVAPLVVTAGGAVCGTQRIIADQDNIFAWHGQADLSAAGLQTLAAADAWLISVPPGMNGCLVAAQINNLLPQLKNLKWIGYLSTTGVYGDAHGGWVDEQSDTKPTSARGEQRVLAEQQWQAWGEKNNVPVQIFRLSGIYGPGRSVFDRIASGDGKIIDAPGHVFNRIHVDDIAQTIMAGYTQGQSGVFNVGDDLPAAQSDVMRFAYDLIGLTPPQRIAISNAELSPMAQEFYRDCKRVCNEKIKNDLGVQLHYPTYVEGLSAIYKDKDTLPSA